ncbi:MAG: protease HtpX [Proteobacteria bacterium]|nr:protease HtpX [Pseudomonadota bacterium]
MFMRSLLMLAVSLGVSIVLSSMSYAIVGQLFSTEVAMKYFNNDLLRLFTYCLIWGFAGAFITLLCSKWFIKRFYRIKIINHNTSNPDERYILQKVYTYAATAGIKKMPEVGIYADNSPNAFATGPSKNKSLVAVSSALMQQLNREEVDGVLAHEVAHIANGDMVTMTLLQGIVNSFVLFFSKIISIAIASAISGSDKETKYDPRISFVIEMVVYILLCVVGMAITNWYSRKREFRADHGGAQLAGKKSMVSALKKLQHLEILAYNNGMRQQGMQTSSDTATASLKISGGHRKVSLFTKIFSTHPPLTDRIARLSQNFM